ncbi:hypothetical protein BJX96DRAFT_31768 [Aspergillus floccosus]
MASSSQQKYQASLPCPSWIWSNNSDVHVAKDRSWFGDDYIPFESFVQNMFGGTVPVIGIGSVDLPTKTSPTKTGPRSHGILRLKNVLHAPSLFCNIIGRPILDDYMVECGTPKDPSGSSGSVTRRYDGRTVAYFKPQIGQVRLWEVRLSGPPVGPRVGRSPFKASGHYALHAFWPDSERQRFADLQTSARRVHTAVGYISRVPNWSSTSTPAEKAWLKTHWGNEYRFLLSHGLSIYKNEDREEGRAILRALMSNDGDLES